MKMQIYSAHMVTPINILWNQSPNSGPKSISISRGSMSVRTEEISMAVSEEIMPDACATTLCAISNTPMTIFHVFVTRSMAAADLNTHLKIIQVSTSCRLFLSVIIWISSSVITIARITPAMGTMMELERLWIMLKMPPFQPCGVCPTCTDISPTCWFTESNIPDRLPIMPPTSISLSHSVSASSRKSIQCDLLSAPPDYYGRGKDFSGTV